MRLIARNWPSDRWVGCAPKNRHAPPPAHNSTACHFESFFEVQRPYFFTKNCFCKERTLVVQNQKEGEVSGLMGFPPLLGKMCGGQPPPSNNGLKILGVRKVMRWRSATRRKHRCLMRCKGWEGINPPRLKHMHRCYRYPVSTLPHLFSNNEPHGDRRSFMPPSLRGGNSGR
jgi:hypothetical protein